MGDAVISAFFAADKPKAREKKRAEVESWLSELACKAQWEKLDAAAASLRAGEHPIPPFHWEIEFPEVFARENGGFDAIVGNPPFAGKNTIIGGQSQRTTCRGCRRCTKARTEMPISLRISSVAPSACCGRAVCSA